MSEPEVEGVEELAQTKRQQFGVHGLTGQGCQGGYSVKLPGLMARPTECLGGMRADIPGWVECKPRGVRGGYGGGMPPRRRWRPDLRALCANTEF